jgi:hypothetical protein
MILNTKPLADIELGFPIVNNGVYFLKIRKDKIEIKPNKKGDGKNLVIPVQVLNDELEVWKEKTETFERQGNNGKSMFSVYISLTEKENYDPNEKIKELALASGHPEDKDFSIADISEYVKAKVKFQPAKGDFGAGNQVDRFYKIEDSDNFVPPAL